MLQTELWGNRERRSLFSRAVVFLPPLPPSFALWATDGEPKLKGNAGAAHLPANISFRLLLRALAEIRRHKLRGGFSRQHIVSFDGSVAATTGLCILTENGNGAKRLVFPSKE